MLLIILIIMRTMDTPNCEARVSQYQHNQKDSVSFLSPRCVAQPSLLCSLPYYLMHSCVGSVMKYGSECWTLTQPSLVSWPHTDNFIIRWICTVKSPKNLWNLLHLPNRCYLEDELIALAWSYETSIILDKPLQKHGCPKAYADCLTK